MKLTKEKLIKYLGPNLKELGFTEFKDSSTGAQGLFIKKISDNLYLSLGTTISRYNEALFTGSFYLSKTTRWASVWGDIPKESYKRVSLLLSQEERKQFLNEDYFNSLDAWWDFDVELEKDYFIKVVAITMERFINQKDLINKINESKEIALLSFLSKKTKEKVILERVDRDLKFQPLKSIDNIPTLWFEAAEAVLKEDKNILNKNTVKLLASDSWRQAVLEE